MGIVTDSTPMEAPKDPDADTVFAIYSLLATPEQRTQMRQNYEGGNYGYGHAKQALYDLIVDKYGEERKRFNYFMENLPELHSKLEKGEAKAREIAQGVLAKVKHKLGY